MKPWGLTQVNEKTLYDSADDLLAVYTFVTLTVEIE
jgi:hypothetical protein